MEYHVFRITRLTDTEIIDLLNAFRTDLAINRARIGYGAGASEDISSATTTEQLDELRGDGYAILELDIHIQVNGEMIDVGFRRGVSSDSSSPNDKRQTSSYFDEVFVWNGRRNQAVRVTTVRKCIDVLERALQHSMRAPEVRGDDVVDALRTEMSALNRTYRRMLDRLAEERSALVQGFDEQRRSVENDRRDALNKVEEENRRRRDEYELLVKQEEDKLDKKKAEIQRREEELDNRQHMHVRRELRKSIVEEFGRRAVAPVVSTNAGRMRWAVFGISLIAGMALAGFGLWTFYLLISNDFVQAAYWLLVLRATILSVGGLGLFLYALRWLRSMYLDDVRTARHYERYRDDIDRASFAIETILEVGSEKEGVAAPDAWIEGVCRNLFQSGSGRTTGGESRDALIQLLNSLSSATVGPSGPEVTLDRRGSRRLAKRLEEGRER